MKVFRKEDLPFWFKELNNENLNGLANCVFGNFGWNEIWIDENKHGEVIICVDIEDEYGIREYGDIQFNQFGDENLSFNKGAVLSVNDAFVRYMARLNKGRTLDGVTYQQALYNYYSAKIEAGKEQALKRVEADYDCQRYALRDLFRVAEEASEKGE